VALGATDMRKGFNGLYGIVRDRLGLEVRSGHLFLFANARRKRIGYYANFGAWTCCKSMVPQQRRSLILNLSYWNWNLESAGLQGSSDCAVAGADHRQGPGQ
jgi:hypothetical protein